MKANPARLLVVDDDIVDRMAFMRFIEREGLPYKCNTAASIAEAKTAIAIGQFDAILLDQNLPDGLGYDLLPHVGTTPVIFVTGSESPESAVLAMKSGANDYLLKDQDRNYLKLMPLAVERALQQRTAREQLRESQELFHLSFNEAPIGMAFISPDGEFVRVNRSLCDMFGATEADFLVKGFQLVFGTGRSPRCMAKMFAMREGKDSTQRVERKCANVGGREIWIQLDVALVPDHQGEVSTYITHIQDITPQRKAEETRARLEVQLSQAQKMEALGTLAGGVAHEFNNLLGAIIGYTELSRMALPVDHPGWSNMDQVLKASHRAKDIVQQILMFSRRQELKRELILVQPMITEAISHLRPNLPAHIEISSEINADCPPIFGNDTQINQALINICTNAWHALGEHAGKIIIGLDTVAVRSDSMPPRLSLPEGQYVLVSIQDNGHGMDENTLNRVFEPFFTTKGPGRGSGLGMPVVHGIMKAHEGGVAIKSELGKGTTVYLYFPASANTPGEAVEMSERPPLPTGDGQHILFVDDQLPLVQIGSMILTHLGYRVTAFTSPKEALEALRQRSGEFDLVITDMTMPLMNGIDMAINCLQLRPGIPVILASGFIEEAIREEAGSLGIREILGKPLTTQEIAEAVHRVLYKKA